MAEKEQSRGRQDDGKGRTRMKVQLNPAGSGGILVLLGGLMATVILSSVFRRRRKPADEVDNNPEEEGGAEAGRIGDDEDWPENSAQVIPPDSSPLTHHQERVNLRDKETNMQASDNEEQESPASGVHATIPEDQESALNTTWDLNEMKLNVSAAAEEEEEEEEEEMEINCYVDDDDEKKYRYPADLDDFTVNNAVRTQDLDSTHDPDEDGVAIHGVMRLEGRNVKEEEEEEIIIMEAINGGDKQQQKNDCCNNGYMKMKSYIVDSLLAFAFGSETRMANAGTVVALVVVVTCSCFSCFGFGISFLKYCIGIVALAGVYGLLVQLHQQNLA